jgi:hypothetical protein
VNKLFLCCTGLVCSSSWGIWFLEWNSYALDRVVVTYFLDVCSVPPGSLV